MLLQRLQSQDLLERIAAAGAYRPAWTAADRAFWETADAAEAAEHQHWIERGRRELSRDWPPLQSLYADYAQTGNRLRFEQPYHQRRQTLTILALAEACERRGLFGNAICHTLTLICAEPSWVVPAHARERVDLFAAETANLLAWVLYLHGGEPWLVDTPAAETAAQATRERVLQPYLDHDDAWWMALQSQRPSNWTTWCTSNCLGLALLLEDDAARRAQAVLKACRSFDRYIEAYSEDGGCDEGPMYWNFAAGCLFDGLEMLHVASAGALDVFAEPAIQRLGAYIAEAHIDGLYFVNFADSPPRVPVDGALLHRWGLRSGDRHMQALGAQLHPLLQRLAPEDTLRLKIYRHLAAQAGRAALRQAPSVQTPRASHYLPRLQVAVAREQTAAGAGLFLAAKGGHNDEQHNHNDVGNVIVSLDGAPVLVDAGLKQYTQDSFNERRYSIWAMQSEFHNVPLVNGCPQQAGRAAGGQDAGFAEQGAEAAFEVDIATAYPVAARLLRLHRRAVLDRNAPGITIEDHFAFSQTGNQVEQRWLCAQLPLLSAGRLLLNVGDSPGNRLLAMTWDPAPQRMVLMAFDLQDPHLRQAWGGRLFQLRLGFDFDADQGRCVMRLQPLNGLPQALASAALPTVSATLP